MLKLLLDVNIYFISNGSPHGGQGGQAIYYLAPIQASVTCYVVVIYNDWLEYRINRNYIYYKTALAARLY